MGQTEHGSVGGLNSICLQSGVFYFRWAKKKRMGKQLDYTRMTTMLVKMHQFILLKMYSSGAHSTKN